MGVLQDAVALGKKMGLDKKVQPPPVEVADVPAPVLKNGTRARIRGGEIPELRKDDLIVGERNADGVVGRVEGAPYISNGGVNKGELIQPIREEGTGMVFGVPARRLQTEDRLGASRVGASPRYAAAYDACFGGSKKSDEWVEVRPGRKVLKGS